MQFIILYLIILFFKGDMIMENVNDYFEQEQMRQTYICEKCNRSISVLTSYKFENFFEPKELKNVQITGAIPPKLDITCNKCRNRMTLLDEECVSFYIKLKEIRCDCHETF